MRFLGLDFGTKKIGIAVSDGLNVSAQGRSTLIRKSLRRDLAALSLLMMSEGITHCVLGLPLNMNGTRGPMVETVEKFAELIRLEHPTLEIILWDERLTSQMVERIMLEADCSRKKRKLEKDRLAAILILQSYLDAHEELRMSGEDSL